MTKEFPSWEEIHQMVGEICEGIEIDDFDLLIGLSVGGLVPLALFSVELGCKEVTTISASSYDGKNQKALTLKRLPKREELEKRSILLIDDIVDSGNTLREIKSLLYCQYGVQKITTASLYVKKGTPEYPDYWSKETTQWIVFPWEVEVRNRSDRPK